MNKKLIFTLVTFSSMVLSSCGLELNEVYYGNAYNSPVFEENFYRVWDERIDPNNSNNKIASEKTIALDETQDLVFTSFYQGFERDEDFDPNNIDPDIMTNPEHNSNLKKVDKNIGKYRYMKDVYGVSEEMNNQTFIGDDYKLTKADDSFKNGYLSKLYDGWMFCGGRFQLSRVQIDEGGFGTIFDKQSDDLEDSYFAMNFKASNDYTQEDNPASAHLSDINIKVSFYCRNDDKYDKVTYTYNLYNLSTNYSDIRLYDTYTFFGFKIDSSVIKNLQGYSIEFDVIRDSHSQEKGLDYSLMLYEVMFPNSTWR